MNNLPCDVRIPLDQHEVRLIETDFGDPLIGLPQVMERRLELTIHAGTFRIDLPSQGKTVLITANHVEIMPLKMAFPISQDHPARITSKQIWAALEI